MGHAWWSPSQRRKATTEEGSDIILTNPGLEPGLYGECSVLNRPHHRLKTPQNASLERIYAAPAQRLKDTKKELTAEEQRDPTLFKEALSSKYSAEIRREGMVLIVPLKHPPPGELSIFEFPIEDSGTIARYGKLLSSTFQFATERYKETRMAVARIRALHWLYWQAQICAIPGRQTFGRPEPTSPAQVPASKPSEPKTSEAPREATPEVTTSRDHTREGKRKKSRGRKPNKTISDRNQEIVALATSGKTPLEIAKHLDARNCSVPHSWTIVEDDGEQYQVRNFEKAYYDPQLHRKLNDLIYDAKKSCAKVVG